MEKIAIIICILLIAFLIIRRIGKKRSYMADMKQCPSCGALNPSDSDFCAECGSSMSLSYQNFNDRNEEHCPVCGAPLKADSVFCANCGSQVRSAGAEHSYAEKDRCPQCGSRIKAGQLFCAECGAPVKNEDVHQSAINENAESVQYEPVNDYQSYGGNYGFQESRGAESFSADDYDMTVIMDDARPTGATLEYFINGISHRIRLDKEVVRIGAAKNGTDFTLPSKKVSKMHAQIRFSNGRYYIKDLNSTNGTYLNRASSRLPADAETEINNGDIIRMGDIEMTFKC